MEILDTIKKYPGISSAEISRILSLSRNSVKYLIDKLLVLRYIRLEKKGRVKELFLTYP
ncbi:MAG: winged helix-turn-helix transcriptional regulator [Candidatus Hermodarchaeota archaeon]